MQCAHTHRWTRQRRKLCNFFVQSHNANTNERINQTCTYTCMAQPLTATRRHPLEMFPPRTPRRHRRSGLSQPMNAKHPWMRARSRFCEPQVGCQSARGTSSDPQRPTRPYFDLRPLRLGPAEALRSAFTAL